MYDMLSEAIVFRPAINKMMDEEEEYGLSVFRLKKWEWRLIEQLQEVLKVRCRLRVCSEPY